MSVYAIGDVQGCYQSLLALLDLIQFDNERDTLWFTGDLVNRGPQSLEVLRFIKSLGEKHKTVLGNHDLHLLALSYGSTFKKEDSLQAILHAPDRDILLEWLRFRPLIHYDANTNYVLVHAGIAPFWSLEQALILAREVEQVLQSNYPEQFLLHMYGNESQFNDALSGTARLRAIVNFLTRMRYCRADGTLDLSFKGPVADKPAQLIPWFDVPDRINQNLKIIFGHWASLDGKTDSDHLFALDTGCVWGNSLTAMRLDDQMRFNVACSIG